MDTYLDTEGPLRDWLKAQQPLLDVLGDAKYVYFGAPDDPSSPHPNSWITFSRLGGAPGRGVLPEDEAYITFDCWGRSKKSAATLAAALVSVLQNVKFRRPTMGGLRCNGADIALGPRWQPDQNGIAAYVIDAFFYFVIPQVA